MRLCGVFVRFSCIFQAVKLQLNVLSLYNIQSNQANSILNYVNHVNYFKMTLRVSSLHSCHELIC